MKQVTEYRNEFPITNNYIYLDHAGIAPVSERVVCAVERYLREASNGASFNHIKWHERVLEVRKSAANLINSEEHEVAFVRSTSHGLSLVAEGMEWKEDDEVIVCEKEFPSNLFAWMQLQSKGVKVRQVPFRGDRIYFEDIENLMNRKTKIISISAVQFVNGFRIDLEQLGTMCKKRGILLCVDAIQGLGVIPIDVRQNNIDFLAADAHKWLLGPEGIGIFFCRNELVGRIRPVITGWKSVKSELSFESPVFELKNNALRFEEGSLNMMGITGLGSAIDLLLEVGIHKIEQIVLELGDHIIESGVRRGLTVITPLERKERAGIITLTGMADPVGLRDTLRHEGIMVNTRGGGIRVSPHFYNTEEDINRMFEVIDGFM